MSKVSAYFLLYRALNMNAMVHVVASKSIKSGHMLLVVGNETKEILLGATTTKEKWLEYLSIGALGGDLSQKILTVGGHATSKGLKGTLESFKDYITGHDKATIWSVKIVQMLEEIHEAILDIKRKQKQDGLTYNKPDKSPKGRSGCDDTDDDVDDGDDIGGGGDD